MTSLPPIRIVHLLEVPDIRPILERWFVEEWMPWYGPDGPGDARSDLAACHRLNDLPICLIALDGNNTPLGTVALKSDSVGSELGLGPWLAAMLVNKDHRGKGVGTALVQAIEEEAARLGFVAIYTSTDTAIGILERRGWKSLATTESIRGPLTVYRWQAESSAMSP